MEVIYKRQAFITPSNSFLQFHSDTVFHTNIELISGLSPSYFTVCIFIHIVSFSLIVRRKTFLDVELFIIHVAFPPSRNGICPIDDSLSNYNSHLCNTHHR